MLHTIFSQVKKKQEWQQHLQHVTAQSLPHNSQNKPADQVKCHCCDTHKPQQAAPLPPLILSSLMWNH